MGDVIDLNSRRPSCGVVLSEVSECADLHSWVDRHEDGSVTVCWSEGPDTPDRGFLLTSGQARALGRALVKSSEVP